jgi:hypothetical protein
MDMTGRTAVNVAREMQQKITEARQSGNLDALIAIENELGEIATETDKMMATVLGQQAQAPATEPEAPAAPLEDVVTGELLPQVDESDAVQTLPADTERKLDEAL